MEKDSKLSPTDAYEAGKPIRDDLELQYGKLFTAQVGTHIVAAAPDARVFRLLRGKRGDWQADFWYKNDEGVETRAVLMMAFVDGFAAVAAAQALYRLVRKRQPKCELMLPEGFEKDAFLKQ